MTETNYTNPQGQQPLVEEESSIDFMELAVKFWKGKWFVIIVTFLFCVLGVFMALNLKRTWTATVTLAPEVPEGAKSGSSLSSIASMMGLGGMNMGGNGADALNITLFPDMAKSTPFLTDLFEVPVNPYLSPKARKEGKKPKKSTTLYRWILKKDEPKGWFANLKESIFGAPDPEPENVPVDNKELTREQDIATQILSKCINADVDKKTGVTTINVTIDDPKLACELADTVCTRLQREIFNYRTAKAAQNLEYYTKLAEEAKAKMIKAQADYAVSVDYNRSIILQSAASEQQRLQQELSLAQQVYTQMQQQVEMAKAKYQEMKPVFVVVQPATIPLKPNQSRAKTAIIYAFLGIFLSAAWKLYGEDFYKKYKSQFKEKMAESTEEKSQEIEA